MNYGETTIAWADGYISIMIRTRCVVKTKAQSEHTGCMLKEKVNGYPEEREKKGFRCTSIYYKNVYIFSGYIMEEYK